MYHLFTCDVATYLTATSKTWTRPLARILKNLDPENLDSEKPGPWKNLDSEKPGPWKTWALKKLDPEKPRIN